LKFKPVNVSQIVEVVTYFEITSGKVEVEDVDRKPNVYFPILKIANAKIVNAKFSWRF
jgi:hypothetical protein